MKPRQYSRLFAACFSLAMTAGALHVACCAGCHCNTSERESSLDAATITYSLVTDTAGGSELIYDGSAVKVPFVVRRLEEQLKASPKLHITVYGGVKGNTPDDIIRDLRRLMADYPGRFEYREMRNSYEGGAEIHDGQL